jgi:pSer/pThr/pTyr-binding forkhead associated (FHA) protein
MCSIQVLSVGRKNTSEKPDISIPENELTVGRKHIEITLGESGKIFITDLNSSNGTFIKESGSWKRIAHSYVTRNSEIRIGDFETTINNLIRNR